MNFYIMSGNGAQLDGLTTFLIWGVEDRNRTRWKALCEGFPTSPVSIFNSSYWESYGPIESDHPVCGLQWDRSFSVGSVIFRGIGGPSFSVTDIMHGTRYTCSSHWKREGDNPRPTKFWPIFIPPFFFPPPGGGKLGLGGGISPPWKRVGGKIRKSGIFWGGLRTL